MAVGKDENDVVSSEFADVVFSAEYRGRVFAWMFHSCLTALTALNGPGARAVRTWGYDSS